MTDPKAAQELLACETRCKGELIVADLTSTDGPPCFRVECQDCGTQGPERATEAEALAVWNTRPTPPAGTGERLIGLLREGACGGSLMTDRGDYGLLDEAADHIATLEATLAGLQGQPTRPNPTDPPEGVGKP